MIDLSAINEIIREVTAWSKKNFGEQRSKADSTMVLGSLAPLLGIGEELGEMYEADFKRRNSTEDWDTDKADSALVDALGDICIYLCDFCGREGIEVPPNRTLEWDRSLEASGPGGICIVAGKLFHAVLKRHQGIRGYDSTIKYITECRDLTLMMFVSIDRACHFVGTDVNTVLSNVWAKVSQRDWTKNKTSGGDLDAPVELDSLDRVRSELESGRESIEDRI